MKSDYHLHSVYSPDSTTPMDDHCVKALELGLGELCFTEHVDYDMDYLYPIRNAATYAAYFESIRQLNERYQGRLRLKTGIEFGIQMHTLAQFRHDVLTYPFDFILLSSHEIGNQEFWNDTYQKGKTQLEYNRGYYQNLLELVRAYDGYSVLAHLDVIKRYDRLGILDDAHCIDLIEAILKEVIRQGKGIEVNTSSYRYGIDDLTPSKAILKLYRSLGGTILTLGSDAHRTEHLGENMDRVKQELRKLGFTRFYTYDRLQPVPHTL